MSIFDSLKKYNEKNIIIIGFLAFCAAIPFPLVFGTLSLWYKEAGIDYTVIGFLGMAKFPYTLRFLWAPLIDGYKIPKFSILYGHRKSWLLIFQIGLVFSIFAMSLNNPANNIYYTAIGALLTAFFSSSQDVVIDALRIEILPEEKQGLGAGAYVFGYRVGLLISGAGVILLSGRVGWNVSYALMSLVIIIGIVAGFFVKENKIEYKYNQNWLQDSIIKPIIDFVSRKGWGFIVAFLLIYKLNNATIATFANPFYTEMGFSKDEIVYVTKMYGFIATLIGGFLGGIIVSKVKMMPCLLWTGIIEGLTSLAFAYLAYVGHDIYALVGVISFDNLVGAIGNVVLIAYLSSLCNRSYTATQYALLVSLISLSRDFFASSTGLFIDNFGFITFFIMNAFLVVPSLFLIKYLPKTLKKE